MAIPDEPEPDEPNHSGESVHDDIGPTSEESLLPNPEDDPGLDDLQWDRGLAAGFARPDATETLSLGDHEHHANDWMGDRYRLLELIGQGGMGTVWVARQTEPVKRVVALKLIRAGMDSQSMLNRFNMERQALAMMDHPNIAKVFDGGISSKGRPYFVMELVKGLPINEYCDQARLTTRERLELLIPVCEAIHHAHQKGIIHRDIKPNNVIVGLYGDKPIPKVIDFGVAKSIEALHDGSYVTHFGMIVGTPEYMSPEQATLNNQDIDTRSDIYSLGALLYDLLAGAPPFSKKELQQAGILEVLKAIREREPLRPSQKLSTDQRRATIAVARRCEPASLIKQLQGDLDWIIMKSMEKDRARRYGSAQDLARDITRFLRNDPIEARPPSRSYRIQKFIVRHLGQVILATCFVAILMAATLFSSLQWQRAVEAQRAEQVQLRNAERERLAAQNARSEAVVQRDRAVQSLGMAREILDAMTSGLGENFLMQQTEITPEQSAFLRQVSDYYERMSSPEANDEGSDFESIVAIHRVGRIQAFLGRVDEATTKYRASLEKLTSFCQHFPEHRESRLKLAGLRGDLAAQLNRSGEREQARQLLRVAIRDLESNTEQFPNDYAFALQLAAKNYGLSLLYRDDGDHPSFAKMARLALQAHQKLSVDFPEEQKHLRLLGENGIALAEHLLHHGQVEEGTLILETSLTTLERVANQEHSLPSERLTLGWGLQTAGFLHFDLQDFERAKRSFARSERVLRLITHQFPGRVDGALLLANTYYGSGQVELRERQWDRALEYLGQAKDVLQRVYEIYPAFPDVRFECGKVESLMIPAYLALQQPNLARESAVELARAWEPLSDASGENRLYHERYRNLAEGWAWASGLITEHRDRYWEYTLRNFQLSRTPDSTDVVASDWLSELLSKHVHSAFANDPHDEREGEWLNAQIRLRDWGPSAEYRLACCLALMSKNQAVFQDQAMHHLRKATHLGWRSYEEAEQNPDLNSLREREDFQQWLEVGKASNVAP